MPDFLCPSGRAALAVAMMVPLACITADRDATSVGVPASTRVAPSSARGGEAFRGPWQPRILDPGAGATIYLPDFSFAGYRWGEEKPPELSPTLEVTDFGARPDDDTDDTAAITKAIAAAPAGGRVVLHFSKGRFIVKNILFLERENLVLQGSGSGPGGTELSMPEPLARMDKPDLIKKREAYLLANQKKVDGAMFSPFSWTGGVIWTRSPRQGPPELLGPALSGRRGAHVLEVGNAGSIKPGETVRVNWYNRGGDDSPLLRHVYGLSERSFGPRASESTDEPLVSQEVTVVAAAGDTLTLKQPLLHDVEPQWQGSLTRSKLLEGVGIEHLVIRFPDVAYGGHHREAGYNGIYLTGLAHSWVRDVRIENADSGILMDDCANVTLERVVVAGRQGHYGIHVGDVYNVLVENFAIDAPEFHSLSFNTKSRGNVFTHGTIYRPSLDQHRGANHQNLFDDISTVEDRDRSELFVHGGAGYWGPTHGAFNTFWNIRLEFTHPPRTPVDLGAIDDAGPARIVGLTANVPVTFQYAGAYTEGIGRQGIAVPSLHNYQLKRRMTPGAPAEVPER
jgi:Pectate lyase superfamily protein